MMAKVSRRLVFLAAVAPIAVLFAGCSGADNPKIADAPVYKPPATPEPSKAPTKPGQAPYGSGSYYQKSMEEAANR